MTPNVGRAGTVLLCGAAGVILVAGIRAASGIIAPVFLALVLTIAVHPARGWAERRGLPGWSGLLLALAGVYFVLIGMSVALVVSVARFATLLPAYEDDARDLVDDITSKLSSFGVDDDVQSAVSGAFDLSHLIGYVADILAGIASASSSLFFLVTLLLFMAVDASHFLPSLERARTEHAAVVTSMRSFAVGTRTYLVVCTVFGLIVAVIDTVALQLLDVPAPLLWGLLAFITNYIPNIGFIIGLVPPAILGLLEGGGSLMLAVIVVYCLVNVIIQSFIQPRFVGNAVGISGTITMISLLFWAWVLGPVGALLAVPLTLLVKAVLVDADPAVVWVSPLLSGRDKNAQTDRPD